MVSYHINKILKDKKITDFLEEKGIYPEKTSGDKMFYKCPIHRDDTVPSFIIYDIGYKGREYQTYYCFGCKSGANIINLKSEIDKISLKDSVNYFLKDIDISDEDVRKTIIEDYKKINEEKEDDEKNINFLFLLINTTCREHIDFYKDDEEIEFFKIFLEKIEAIARARDFETLEKSYDILNRGLENRVDKFLKRKEKEEISSISWRI